MIPCDANRLYPSVDSIVSLPLEPFPVAGPTVLETAQILSKSNPDIDLYHYLHEITQDLKHIPNERLEIHTRNKLAESAQYLGVSIKDVQSYADLVAEGLSLDETSLAARPSIVARKSIYLAFIAASAAAMAQRTIEIETSVIQ